MWLNVLTVLLFICFGFLLDVSSGNAESMDADLVKRINHVNATVETMVSNYHELLKTVREDGRTLDSLIKQNKTLNQRLNKTVEKMEKLVTNEKFLNLTIQALQTLTSEQQRAINEEKNMSKKLTSNYSDRLLRVNREVEFLKKQNHYLEQKLNTTVEKMEKLMSEKEISSYNIENLQNITSQQQHELKKVEKKSKESTISIGYSLTLLNNQFQELTNSTRIGFKKVNAKVLKEKKLLRTEMQNFEKRIKQRINKKLDKIDPGCQQPLQAGPCSDYTVNYFFNTNSSKCERFWYGGCQGNQNNFKSDEECQAACVQDVAIDLQKMTKDVIDLNTKVANLELSTDKSLANLTLISSKLEKTLKDVQELKPDVDGQWSRWIDTPSSVTCGVGCRLRYRECSNPYPERGGKKCTGSRNKHVTCLQYDPCPVHGTWSVWSETTCSVTCGVGTSLRFRNCSNPHPQYGGNNCTGKSIDYVTCTQPDKCPVNGAWSVWSDHTCSVTCGVGTRTRSRTCSNPSPQYGGNNCIGNGRDLVTCTQPNKCPDGRTCPDFVGRDPSRLPRSGDNRANLLINNIFPCRGYVVAWQYYRIVPRYTGYVGVWRQINDLQFRLIGKTELPIANEGNQSVFVDPPIAVEKGDFIGIFYPKLAEEGVVASATRAEDTVNDRELYQNYYARIYNEDASTGSIINLNGTEFQDTKATFALKAIMDYTGIDVTPGLIISPARVEAKAGGTVQLRCQPGGTGPFIIEWLKVDGVLNPSATQNRDGLLEIRQVTAADTGQYRCLATGNSGLSDGFAIVTITVPPTITLSQREARPYLGQLMELRCQASGNPPPSITWEKENGVLPRDHTVNNGVLQIFNVRQEDSGRYICQAASPAGVDREYVTLTVQGRTTYNTGPIRKDTETVIIGTQVHMKCFVTGTPKPTVTWSRIGEPLPETSKVNDVILVIPNVRIEDAGTYVCTAKNLSGTIQQRINLFVKVDQLT